ncbi:amidohydrolase family protein [Chloroflexota bacterium]
MNEVDLLINNGMVVTMDTERRIIDGGSIAIQKDKIIDICPTSELKSKYNAKEVIDATKMLVLPGLINGHTHARDSLYRGVDDGLTLEQASEKLYGPLDLDPTLSPQYTHIGTLLSCLTYIRTGTTCFVDQDVQAPEVASAVEKAGIRGILAPFMGEATGEFFGTEMSGKEKVLKDAVEFYKDWNGKADGRIRCWFGPIHELGTSKDLLADIVALAEQYNTGIHIHLAEAKVQRDTVKSIYGKTSIEYAYDLGLLRRGTVVSHCCWLTPHDISLLAKSGATVAHAPATEMKVSDGITPVPYLLEAGVNVTIGTDGAGIDNGSNDLIREMKIVTLLHKVGYPLYPEILTAEKALEMVTVNGARAVMWDNELGSLEKGKKADIILIDMAKPQLTPILRKPKFNVINLLVYSAVGDDVDTVIVNGKIIMFHREILTLDEDKITEEAQAAAEKLLKVSGVDKETFPWRWSM